VLFKLPDLGADAIIAITQHARSAMIEARPVGGG
jgi:hypothetical protein